ncbi:hypothetical protein NUK34_08270 [Kerstersia gyiorum]|uniref:hypothetical protein n=1 Tax=Kerstersia gyiorum TaxID=206506 RepID=UPI00215058A6|nr:hypothetical protein [Kerstersia gyiorum]MCR4158846.1 hypothetical protein [Kerstersia gyiorum]
MVLFKLAITNMSTVAATVGLRLRKSTESALIVPADILPAEAGDSSSEIRIHAVPLEPGDVLEAYSDNSVSWLALGQQLPTLKPYSRLKSAVAGDVWTVVSDVAGMIGGIRVANTSMGSALVSARIVAGSTVIRVLFDGEEVEAGASRRLVNVDVLAAGQSLQVKSIGGIDVVVTGVRA